MSEEPKQTFEEAARSAFAGCDLSNTAFGYDDFPEARVHDWRNHVPDSVEQAWPTLSERERLLVIAVADHAASQEEWD